MYTFIFFIKQTKVIVNFSLFSVCFLSLTTLQYRKYLLINFRMSFRKYNSCTSINVLEKVNKFHKLRIESEITVFLAET